MSFDTQNEIYVAQSWDNIGFVSVLMVHRRQNNMRIEIMSCKVRAIDLRT